ncbi:MAG: methyltransferase domain-containing protein [Okeania sp. SIO2F4]|uniref:class I SAM-dependent methyltransferase n=1 Tax=Okeania sp. SIO2F4 TaxID=2607790 RepID=UPI00142D0C8F|nr:methyltransferase domain-containing protein [Okeania sp. SIO2F4]NES06026.1 methyltransferase domain-containing protein [Okeania sp. SIO2F4]
MYENKEYPGKNYNDVADWVFGAEIANRFTDEAEKHIPDYWKVIELTINILKDNIPKDGYIIDVGCASGNTLLYLSKQGFKNLFGIDYSQEMLKVASKNLSKVDKDFPSRLFHSKTFVQNMSFNAIICNWTLHFIQERQEYLKAIFDSLISQGLFILTEKTLQSKITENQYILFKQNKGLSNEEIERKKQQLEGVLNPFSVIQNLELLTTTGFSKIEIINARLGFITFLCIKS